MRMPIKSFVDWFATHKSQERGEEITGAQVFKIIDHWADELKRGLKHDGDCIKQPCSCQLCGIEEAMQDYRAYTQEYYNLPQHLL